jgi:hypothetical protein
MDACATIARAASSGIRPLGRSSAPCPLFEPAIPEFQPLLRVLGSAVRAVYSTLKSRKWVAFSVWRFGVPAILTAVGKKSAQKTPPSGGKGEDEVIDEMVPNVKPGKR